MLTAIKRTLESTDTSLDAQLNDFIKRLTDRLLLRLGVEFLPLELHFIVIETTVKRFNLKGNEGMSSYSQEGESIKYSDLLDEYKEDIALWINNRDLLVDSNLGIVRFI